VVYFFMLLDNDTLSEAVEEFISSRINEYGSDVPAVLQETAQTYKECADRLLPTLSPEQEGLWNKIDSAQSLLDGETMNYYYRAGFADALSFIFKMGGINGESN
jgi:hypothetical protein